MPSDLHEQVHAVARAARGAAARLVAISGGERSTIIQCFANALRQAEEAIRQANAIDVAAAESAGLAPALIERLMLDSTRIEGMARGVDQIANQPDPIGQTIQSHVRHDGLRIEKRRVPIGVILFFYESRPNVTADAAALCLKSGNAVILRGGKEALHSNRAIVDCFRSACAQHPALAAAVQFIDNPDRALVPILLKLDQEIDLVIPRGGESLIRAVVAESTIPVLKHFTGNCHIYIDEGASSVHEAVEICVNAKTSYPGGAVCNAVEHILVHRDVAAKFLQPVCKALADHGVEIRGDERTRLYWPDAKPATQEDWTTEYLAPVIGVRVVDSIKQAIEHINEYGSHHTDAILSDSANNIEKFVREVDSASILVNASTRLADGGEYGLGAEIGISTDKLHARGPMGAVELTTCKWVVTGAGHLRR